jgi:hypothetical protein
MEPKLTVGEPRHFGTREVMLVNIFATGVALLPFGAMLAIGIVVFVASLRFGLVPLGFFVCLGLFGGMAVLLLPFANNYYVARLVRRHIARPENAEDTFIVQIALNPRVYGGLRGFLEDADDVGYLRFADDGLAFEGDSVNVRLPYDRIDRIEDCNVGVRGFWVVGRRVRVYTKSLPPYCYIEFLEREGLSIRRTRQVSDSIIQAIMRGTRLSPKS